MNILDRVKQNPELAFQLLSLLGGINQAPPGSRPNTFNQFATGLGQLGGLGSGVFGLQREQKDLARRERLQGQEEEMLGLQMTETKRAESIQRGASAFAALWDEYQNDFGYVPGGPVGPNPMEVPVPEELAQDQDAVRGFKMAAQEEFSRQLARSTEQSKLGLAQFETFSQASAREEDSRHNKAIEDIQRTEAAARTAIYTKQSTKEAREQERFLSTLRNRVGQTIQNHPQYKQALQTTQTLKGLEPMFDLYLKRFQDNPADEQLGVLSLQLTQMMQKGFGDVSPQGGLAIHQSDIENWASTVPLWDRIALTSDALTKGARYKPEQIQDMRMIAQTLTGIASRAALNSVDNILRTDDDVLYLNMADPAAGERLREKYKFDIGVTEELPPAPGKSPAAERLAKIKSQLSSDPWTLPELSGTDIGASLLTGTLAAGAKIFQGLPAIQNLIGGLSAGATKRGYTADPGLPGQSGVPRNPSGYPGSWYQGQASDWTPQGPVMGGSAAPTQPGGPGLKMRTPVQPVGFEQLGNPSYPLTAPMAQPTPNSYNYGPINAPGGNFPSGLLPTNTQTLFSADAPNVPFTNPDARPGLRPPTIQDVLASKMVQGKASPSQWIKGLQTVSPQVQRGLGIGSAAFPLIQGGLLGLKANQFSNQLNRPLQRDEILRLILSGQPFPPGMI